MKPDERVRTVYGGRTPDQVPLMLDLSHWYKRNTNVPFDLTGFTAVESGLVDLHKRIGAVAYVEMGGPTTMTATSKRKTSSTAMSATTTPRSRRGCTPGASAWPCTWTGKAAVCSAGWPIAVWIAPML